MNYDKRIQYKIITIASQWYYDHDHRLQGSYDGPEQEYCHADILLLFF